MQSKIINGSSTLVIYSVDDFGHLSRVWPALLESLGAKVDRSSLLGRLLGCITNGLVLVVEKDGSFFGFSSVEVLDQDNAVIHSLPISPASVPCLDMIREWAKIHGLNCIKIISHHLNGSNFRYIEKTLGFHREAVIFVQHVNLYG